MIIENERLKFRRNHGKVLSQEILMLNTKAQALTV